MAKPRSIRDCHNARELTRVCANQGAIITPCARGVAKIVQPGRGFVPLHQDHGQYRPDQLRFLIKQLARLGFVCLAAIASVAM